MKKIISLFKRDYEGTRQVINEVVSNAEWVIAGEGIATVKYDGTACMIRRGKLYKRYDRKPSKKARKLRAGNEPWKLQDFKPAPAGWEPCEAEPNLHTGHWPGWMPISDEPMDKHHKEARDNYEARGHWPLPGGTYELVGPKIQGNPYGLSEHVLWRHGASVYTAGVNTPPRDFEGLKGWFTRQSYSEYDALGPNWPCEGVVWHHPDGRMVKIKRRDFGLPWPPST